MPLLDTQGNDSADAYGGGAPAVVPNYIENVFSTYLYKGNGNTLAINNGINLATNGGLVWAKIRTSGTKNHVLWDTNSGGNNSLATNLTIGQNSGAAQTDVITFDTSGFTFGSSGTGNANDLGANAVSWTFRKQPNFFDVVTFTGTGSVQNISHNLGSAPGCIIVKRTDASANWSVYHKSLNEYRYISLNLTTGETISSAFWNNTAPTSTVFTVGTNASVNASGGTYVAYLFASDAGGFGLTGTDNVITCGQFDTNGASNATVTLGYEPQFILFKSRNYADNWIVVDTMRGWNYSQGINYLEPNATVVEANYSAGGYPTATGFQVNTGNPSSSYIYIAIRRGPMAVPTTGTSVFSPVASSATTGTITSGFPTDMVFSFDRTSGTSSYNRMLQDRLRGDGVILDTSATVAEYSNSSTASFGSNTGVVLNGGSVYSDGFIHEQFRRAPSFFDEVCYTGNSTSGTTIAHNLGVAPELIIAKERTLSRNWYVGNTPNGWTTYLQMNLTNASVTQTDIWNDTAPSSSVFTVGSSVGTNQSGNTYVAYLFATCPGVSKVGSYTGNGSTQAIACGFTGGARFVLIKRTDATGGWYIYDTARGMTTLTDPYLFTNTTAAEVATLGSVTTTTGGFTVNASVLSAINTNAANYIFLAIA